jgi:hypothetical protein
MAEIQYLTDGGEILHQARTWNGMPQKAIITASSNPQ